MGSKILKFFGIIFIIILIVLGCVFLAQCILNRNLDDKVNTDGNPVMLTRSAKLKDFTLNESVEATITNLKESYILIPNVDINNLKLTFRYYDDNNNRIATKTIDVGNVKKSSQYTVSVTHTLSELFAISHLNYYVSGGTVYYFE